MGMQVPQIGGFGQMQIQLHQPGMQVQVSPTRSPPPSPRMQMQPNVSPRSPARSPSPLPRMQMQPNLSPRSPARSPSPSPGMQVHQLGIGGFQQPGFHQLGVQRPGFQQ